MLASVPKLSEPSDLLEVPRIAGTMLLVSVSHESRASHRQLRGGCCSGLVSFR